MEEKRINGGYEIIESCTIGNNELVIGHNAKALNPYVCWYCKDGSDYFWGYYCNQLSEAREKLNPESAFAGSYCTEYGFRVDTEKHAFLFRCNPTKGDYNFYCYCFVKEWLDKHIQKAEQGIRFIDPNYKELFRIPDGGKIIITSSWGEKTERPCRFIDEYHTEIGNNIFHICEFAERMEQNGATYEPKPTEPQAVTKAPKHKDLER